MDDNELKNKIIDCIASESNIYRICEKVYGLLEKQCTPTALEFFFVEMDAYLCSERYQPDGTEIRTAKELVNKYGKVWGAIMDTLMSERLDREKFYARLWDSICNTPLFDSREAQICILYLSCENMCIPYYRFRNEIQIGEEQYQECIDELHSDITAARSLVFQPCRQYTERAAALLELLEEKEEHEKKVVLFAQMLKLLEMKMKLKKDMMA